MFVHATRKRATESANQRCDAFTNIRAIAFIQIHEWLDHDVMIQRATSVCRSLAAGKSRKRRGIDPKSDTAFALMLLSSESALGTSHLISEATLCHMLIASGFRALEVGSIHRGCDASSIATLHGREIDWRLSVPAE